MKIKLRDQIIKIRKRALTKNKNVKFLTVMELTIHRKSNDSPISICTVDNHGQEVRFPDSFHTIKQYFNMDGELLAEKDITMEQLQEMTGKCRFKQRGEKNNKGGVSL